MNDIWKSRKAWLVILASGLLIGLIDASTYLLLPSVGRQTRLGRVAVALGSYWITFALLVPAVLFMAGRFRLDKRPYARPLAIHTIGACCFVLVHFASAALVGTRPDGRISERFINLLRDYSAGNFLQYWAIVGLFHAIVYYHEARQSEVRAAQLQSSLMEARLQSLRSQLNPHFLFNTLNTISVLAQKNDQGAVTDTITRLSELLRATLDDSRPQEIPLTDELEFLNRYLEIQRTRFLDRLTVQYDIAPETQAALVPSMILQPLIENAIRYSITEQCGEAMVAIRSAREGDALVLTVLDNGPGFASPDFTTHRRHGIGLSNTEARLEHLYGGRQLVSYDTLDTSGGVVTVSFPFHTGPDTFAD